MSLRFRRAGEKDLGLVYDTMVLSFKKSWYAGPYPMPAIMTATRSLVDAVLARPTVECWVAAKEDDDEYLVGYVLWEPPGKHHHHRQVCGAPVLIWAHTKDLYRHGEVLEIPVATSLMRHVGLNPRQPFCYPMRPYGTGDVILREHWTGGRWKPETYKFPPQP